MQQYTPWLLILSLGIFIVLAVVRRDSERSPLTSFLVVTSLIFIVGILRGFGIVSGELGVSSIYGGILAIHYTIKGIARGFYKDPSAREYIPTDKTPTIHVQIPTKDEDLVQLGRCIRSVIWAAKYAYGTVGAEIHITVVDDASLRVPITAEFMTQFADPEVPISLLTITGAQDGVKQDIPPILGYMRQKTKGVTVTLASLLQNQGKKGAIVFGIMQSSNWKKGYEAFERQTGIPPEKAPVKLIPLLIQCLEDAGCPIVLPDILVQTDSDSEIVSHDYFVRLLAAFQSDETIGAVSAHCDVAIPENGLPSLATIAQIAWYYGQFAFHKAAESAMGGAVACVSGPGAAWKTEAVFPALYVWVYDKFRGGIYRGATDRRLTWLVHSRRDAQGRRYKVVYAKKARVKTIVPSTWRALNDQWVRWKQNFWRMVPIVLKVALRMNIFAAFTHYSRLMITMLAPLMLTWHMVLLLLGDFGDTIIYIAGIAFFGSIMAFVYLEHNPTSAKYFGMRIILSLLSAFLGSILTFVALDRSLSGSFAWRGTETATKRERKLLGSFLPIVMVLMIIVLITIIVHMLRTYFGFDH